MDISDTIVKTQSSLEGSYGIDTPLLSEDLEMGMTFFNYKGSEFFNDLEMLIESGKKARAKVVELADLMIANDIGTARYRKNPENNEILVVNSSKTVSSGWKNKEKIVKLIRKELERRIE